MTNPALIILPNLLGPQDSHSAYFPPGVDEAVSTLDGLIAESPQAGRSYLNQFKTKKPPYDIPLAILNEHTRPDEIDFFLKPIQEGKRFGLISDAGLPCLADPGSRLVFRARQLGVSIETYPGPSSIIMGIQLSGLPSQRFTFHGYLNRDEQKRGQEIVQMEKESLAKKSTQIFIEAPYRNKFVLEALLKELQPSTTVCIAWDLTLPTQRIVVQKIEALRKGPPPNIEKKPAIFLLYAANPIE